MSVLVCHMVIVHVSIHVSVHFEVVGQCSLVVYILGSFQVCGCLSIVIEAWKYHCVGTSHLQLLEVLWNSPWVCECAEHRVHVWSGAPCCKCTCIQVFLIFHVWKCEFLFFLQELFPWERWCVFHSWWEFSMTESRVWQDIVC